VPCWLRSSAGRTSRVRTGTRAQAVHHDGTAFTLALSDGTEVTGNALLVAAGRRTDLPGIGVGVVGVDESAHTIPVDDHLRVAPGVWAIGDITGHGAFTHMSMYQADIVVHDILGEEVSPPSTTPCPG